MRRWSSLISAAVDLIDGRRGNLTLDQVRLRDGDRALIVHGHAGCTRIDIFAEPHRRPQHQDRVAPARPDEPIEPLRLDRAGELETVARMAASWAADLLRVR
jgi:hypothetical protein